MSENQTSAKSTVEGELSLDDLEKIAGGTGSLENNGFSNVLDTEILKKNDGMWAFDGQQGTSQSTPYEGDSMNMSLTFT